VRVELGVGHRTLEIVPVDDDDFRGAMQRSDGGNVVRSLDHIRALLVGDPGGARQHDLPGLLREFGPEPNNSLVGPKSWRRRSRHVGMWVKGGPVAHASEEGGRRANGACGHAARSASRA
jgi:hypothetical protein